VEQRVFRTLDDVTDWQPLRSPTRRGLASLRASIPPPPTVCRPA
jgi:hypothetical protein